MASKKKLERSFMNTESFIYSIKTNLMAWIQFVMITLAAPLFLFPSMKYIWIFLSIPSIWIWRLFQKNKFFQKTIIDWALLLLTIQVLATCIIVPDIKFSLPKISGYVFGISLFYSLNAILITKKLIRLGILFYLLGGFFFLIVSILGMTRYNQEYRPDLNKVNKLIPRIEFNLPGAEQGFNPNAIGGILILVIPLFIILLFPYFQKEKMKNNVLYKNKIFLFFLLIGLLFLSIGLWVTHSRGSYIGLLLSLWFLIWWNFKEKKKRLIGFALIFFFLAGYVATVGINNIPSLIKDIEDKFELRLKTWNLAIEEISTAPIFGIGMNQLRKHPLLDYNRAHAHNHFLHIAAELGIPGLIAYLAILIGTGFMCIKIWQNSGVGWMKMTGLGLGCGQLGHFIFGISDSIPLGAKVGIFFWFSIVLITSIYNYMVRDNMLRTNKE